MSVPSISIWENCDPGIAEAVARFQGRWRPSSNLGHSLRLMAEIIDPAVSCYAAALPEGRRIYVAGGVGNVAPPSAIARLIKFDGLAQCQRRFLRRLINTRNSPNECQDSLIATLETLFGLYRACARKGISKSKVLDTQFNADRKREFCRFCGAIPEFSAFSSGDESVEIYPPDTLSTRRLSSHYCEDHLPKRIDGTWNPNYRKAKRSQALFDLELSRLTRQSARLRLGEARSGDTLVDAYLWHYVYAHGLQPADEALLRDHARRMADNKISDRKKKMVILQRYGASQSDIARKLGIQRQAVFKALAAIPKPYRQIPLVLVPPADFWPSTMPTPN